MQGKKIAALKYKSTDLISLSNCRDLKVSQTTFLFKMTCKISGRCLEMPLDAQIRAGLINQEEAYFVRSYDSSLSFYLFAKL